MIRFTTVPTAADVKSKSVSVSVDVTPVTDLSQYKEATDNMWDFFYTAETTDFYLVEYTFTNLHDLVLGYNGTTKSGVGITNITADSTFTGVTDIADKIQVNQPIDGYSTNLGFDGNDLTFTLYTTNGSDPYPHFGTPAYGAAVTNPTFTTAILFAVNKGATPSFSLKSTTGVSYSLVNGTSFENCPSPATLPANNSFTLTAEEENDKGALAVDSLDASNPVYEKWSGLGKYYVVGEALDISTAADKYLKATIGLDSKTTVSKIGELIDVTANTGVVGSVIPVLVVDEAEKDATVTFGVSDTVIK